MISIGEFSNICGVSTKALRYYAEIGLILPNEINPENGYRYYSIEQLDTMLFIKRLKSYDFSLEEIKEILAQEEVLDEVLYQSLIQKKKDMEVQLQKFELKMNQLKYDINNLKQGKSLLSYLEDIDVQLIEFPRCNLLTYRKSLHKEEIKDAYSVTFHKLLKKIQKENLTIVSPPLVLFHSEEFGPEGMDMEFAFPIQEIVTGTRNFDPGLCLKTILKGSYGDLPSIYTKQVKWAEANGYECSDALFEIYVTDVSEVKDEKDLITEVYYPVRKSR